MLSIYHLAFGFYLVFCTHLRQGEHYVTKTNHVMTLCNILFLRQICNVYDKSKDLKISFAYCAIISFTLILR